MNMAVEPMHELGFPPPIVNLLTTYVDQWGYPSTYVTLDHEHLMVQPT